MNAFVLPALALMILVGIAINAWLIFRGEASKPSPPATPRTPRRIRL